MNTRPLRRPASREDVAEFHAALLRAYDELGIGHGELFVIAKAKVDGTPLGEASQPHVAGSATSKAAAAAGLGAKGTRQRVILEAVAARPQGATRDELCKLLDLPMNKLGPRVVELLERDYLERTDATRATRDGQQAEVLVATAKARRELKGQPHPPSPPPAPDPAPALFDVSPSSALSDPRNA